MYRLRDPLPQQHGGDPGSRERYEISLRQSDRVPVDQGTHARALGLHLSCKQIDLAVTAWQAGRMDYCRK